MGLMEAVNYVDTVLKVAGWSAILFSFGAVAYFQNKSCRAIYSFFKEAGITWPAALRISILCRKDWSNNVRLFMEYSIFSTRGKFMKRSEWSQIIRDFDAKYLTNLRREYKIKIKNTFILKDENVKRQLEEYFSFLKEEKNQKLFSIDTSQYLSLVANLWIEEGYVVPLVQINSLQERYNSDWSKILNQYVSTFNKKERKFPSEVSSFYTWLMWGPSVYVSGKENEYKLCLYGLGDESMAVPLVLTDSQRNNDLWKLMQKNSEKNEMGLFISGEFKLCDQKSYFEKKYNRFGESMVHFAEGYMNDSVTGGILEEISYEINQRMEDSEYIFSAYIWIMLCYDIEGEPKTGFDCRRSTVWFEHANIADNGNVELLTRTLVQKCISYLETIWKSGQYKNRIYRIAWAVNEPIKKALEEQIMSIQKDTNHPYYKEFTRQVDLKAPAIFRDSILDNLDDEFNDDTLSIEYTHINFEKPEDLGLLGRFYYELYAQEFPDENERESLDNIIRQAKRIKEETGCAYHCIIAMRGQKIAGGIIGDYFRESNSGVIEFVVVSRDIRNQRLGSGLISNLVNFFNADAKRLRGTSVVDYYFFEVENPSRMEDESVKEICRGRLDFWNKMSAKIVCIPYVQPPLEAGKESVDYLFLAIRVLNDELSTEEISRENIFRFLREFFYYAFGLKNIEECSEYQKMQQKITEDPVRILRISDVVFQKNETGIQEELSDEVY